MTDHSVIDASSLPTEQPKAKPNFCIDCGTPCSGLRCRPHHGDFMRRQALEETATRDREVIAMVAADRLSGQRLADRMGISKTQALGRLKMARLREAARSELAAR